MSEMTPARLDAIRDRLNDAPPAPWDAAPDCFGPTVRVYAGDHRTACEVGLMCDEDRRDSIAALIAAAPTDLRDLLAEVERLQVERDAALAALRNVEWSGTPWAMGCACPACYALDVPGVHASNCSLAACLRVEAE